MSTGNRIDDRLADDLEAILGATDCYLVLGSDGLVLGAGFGVGSLRLLGNCMFERFENFGEQKDPRPLLASCSRSIEIKEKMQLLAKRRKSWIIACYYLAKSEAW